MREFCSFVFLLDKSPVCNGVKGYVIWVFLDPLVQSVIVDWLGSRITTRLGFPWLCILDPSSDGGRTDEPMQWSF